MHLRTRAVTIALICVAATLASSATGIVIERTMQGNIDRAIVVSHAVKLQRNTDMYHDGLRSIVLSALLSNELSLDRATIEQDLRDMLDNISSDLASLKALPLTENERAALDGVERPFADYVQIGKAITAQAFLDRPEATKQIGEFETYFSQLEGSLEKVGNVIENSSNEIEVQASAFADLAWWGIIASLTVSVGATGLMLLFAFRSMLRPLMSLTGAMNTLAGGAYDIDIPYKNRSDELGEMAAALETLRCNSQERNALTEVVAEERAEALTRKQQLESLALDFLKKADDLKTVLDRQAIIVKHCANNLGSAANTTEQQAGRGLTASTDAAASVETVAAAAEELSVSTHRIAERAKSSESLTRRASEKAAHANQDIQKLSRVAGNINSILETISKIATQTNLLSLNATIEAARAGETGKGFAVVASEVKALADRTVSATAEVRSLVTEIDTSTTSVVEAIADINAEIEEANVIATEIASAVSEQETATREIAMSAQRASTSTNGAKSTSASVSEVVQKSRAGVLQMNEAAQSLETAIKTFATGIDYFLGAISPEMQDRRKSIRHLVTHKVGLSWQGGACDSNLEEISLTGCKIAPAPHVAIGSRIVVHIHEMKVHGKMLWNDGAVCGIGFDEPLKDMPQLFLKSEDDVAKAA